MTNSEKLDLLIDKVSNLDDKVSSLDEKVSNLDDKVSDLDKKVRGLDEKVSDLDAEVKGLDAKVNNLESDMREVKVKVTKIDLTIENEIRVNIQRVAEGHLDLSRNLHDAMKPNSEMEMLAIKVRKLESDVGELKHKIS